MFGRFDHASLIELARRMRDEGEASRVVVQEPTYRALLISLGRREQVSELHERADDIYIVLEGARTVTVGGALVGERTPSEGEWVGGGITGGTTFNLFPGDVLHIPRNTAHMLHADDEIFTYLIFKVL